MQTAIAIIDIDGTISDPSLRLHLIKGTERPDWDAFYRACGDDPTLSPAAEVVRRMHEAGRIEWGGFWTGHGAPAAHTHVVRGGAGRGEIVFVTGRSESAREATTAWLMREVTSGAAPELLMRADGDYRKAAEVKTEIVRRLIDAGRNVVFAMDDEESVLEAFAALGIWGYLMENGNVVKSVMPIQQANETS